MWRGCKKDVNCRNQVSREAPLWVGETWFLDSTILLFGFLFLELFDLPVKRRDSLSFEELLAKDKIISLACLPGRPKSRRFGRTHVLHNNAGGFLNNLSLSRNMDGHVCSSVIICAFHLNCGCQVYLNYLQASRPQSRRDAMIVTEAALRI